MRIVASVNTEVPSWLALKEQGWEIKKIDSVGSKKLWVATKNGTDFIGGNPIELMGLIAMYEARGEQWQAEAEQIEEYQEKYPD